MKLYIDVGNSNIVCANKNQENVFRIETNKVSSLDDITFISKDVTRLIVSSVVPKISQLLESYANKNQLEIIFVAYNNQDLIHVVTSEVGNDLITAAIALNTKYESGIVIDLGTATKFIQVKDQAITGVIIACGIEVGAKALTANAALLESFELKAVPTIFGTNTPDSLNAGFVNGHILMLQGLIKKCQDELGENNFILTGGLAYLVKDYLGIEYDENLLLKGLESFEENYYALKKH